MGVDTKAGFNIFEHTADIGLNIYGPEINDVFEYAAHGMFSIIFHDSPPKIEPKGEYQIKLQVSDLDQLLVEWLNELLYVFSTEHIIFSNYKLSIDINRYTLDAQVSGQITPNEKLLGICEIKAVTYHLLNVKKTTQWEATVLFDI